MSTRHITSLPDLALLEVFANLPLSDLFTHVPLVCRNWARLQPESLHRRKHLYLVPKASIYLRQFDAHFKIAEFNTCRFDSLLDSVYWCADENPSSFSKTTSNTDLELNILSLPRHPSLSTTSTTRHLKALSSVQAGKCLARAMPHVTQLTVIVTDQEAKYAQSKATVISYITRLVRHYGPNLTVLRLYLDGSSGVMMKPLDDLFTTINTSLPRLRSLQIHLDRDVDRDVQLKVTLSGQMLARLRLLALIAWEGCNRSNWLSELATACNDNNNPDNPLEQQQQQQQQLRIVLATRRAQSLVPQLLLQESVARHLPVLSVHLNQAADLGLLGTHLRWLTALQLHPVIISSADMTVDWQLHRDVLARLAAAFPLLTCLSLGFIRLPPPIPTETQKNAAAIDQDLPVLRSVRRLTLNTNLHLNYDSLTERLALAQCFPSLERLTLRCSNCMFNGYYQCCYRNSNASVKTMLRKLTLACPMLTDVKLDLPGVGYQLEMRLRYVRVRSSSTESGYRFQLVREN